MRKAFYDTSARELLFMLMLFFTATSVVGWLWGMEKSTPLMASFQTMILSLLTFGVPALAFWYMYGDGKPWRGLHMSTPPRWRAAVYAVVLVFVSAPMVGYVSVFVKDFSLYILPQDVCDYLNEAMREREEYMNLMMGDGAWDMLPVSILVLGVIPALCEEMFFRGTLQRIMMRAFHRPMPAVVMTSAVFTLLHADFLNWVGIFICGGMLGLLYLYTSSLWVPVAFHMVWNIWNIVMMYMERNYPTPPDAVTGTGISPIMAGLSFFVTWSLFRTCRQVQYMERRPIRGR